MNNAKLKSLQAKWRRKLKASGFEDIENERGELLRYNLPRTPVFDRKDATDSISAFGGGRMRDRFEHEHCRMLGNMRYYELCRYVQHTPAYQALVKERPAYGIVWEMHAEGITHQKCAKAARMSYQNVKLVVKRIRELFKEVPHDEFDSDP